MKEEFSFDDFKEAVRPAICWLQQNGDPHQSIIIEFDKVRLVSDLAGVPIEAKE